MIYSKTFRSCLLTIFMVLFCIDISAQTVNKGVIAGSLIDEKKIALPFATIVLSNYVDAGFYSSVISNEQGVFKIDGIKKGTYTVEIKMMGFETYSKRNIIIDDANYNLDLGVLQLQPSTKMLNAVTITAARPFIERRADKIVVNMSSNMNDGSIMDMMNKMPGVQVDPTDRISLNGRGVRIYIDGKATPLSSDALAGLLKGMNPASIQKVELIANPSSKYDAAGDGGIINIVRKRNYKAGLNGNVYGGMEQWQNGKHNGGINLNYKAEQYNLFLNTDYSFSKSYANPGIITDIFNTDLTLKSETISQINSIRQNRTYTPSLGIDLYLDKKNTLSFSVTKWIAQLSKIANSYTDEFDGSGVKTGQVLFFNPVKTRNDNFASGMHFAHQIDTLGNEYTVDLDYYRYNSNSGQDNSNTQYDASGNFINNERTFFDQRRKFSVYSAKADYTKPLKGQGSFETGWKSSYVVSDNSNQLYNVAGDARTLDVTKNDLFKYTENINAVYANYSKIYKKFTYQLGIRGENTWGRGEQLQTGETFNRNYLQLFPSAYFDQKFNKGHGLNLSLNKRTDRPTYENLNPLVRIINSTTYQQGNPDLQPVISYNTSLTYSYKNALYASFNYGINLHDFTYFTTPYDNSGITTTRPSNNSNTQRFSFILSYNKQLNPWWFTSSNINLSRQSFKSADNDNTLNSPGIVAFNFDTYDGFNLTKKLLFMVLFRYRGRSVERNLTNDPYFTLTSGLRQVVFGTRGVVALNVSDIFHSYKNRYVQNSAGIKQYWNNSYETRMLRLNFTYNFGGKIKKTTTSAGADEEKQRTKAKED